MAVVGLTLIEATSSTAVSSLLFGNENCPLFAMPAQKRHKMEVGERAATYVAVFPPLI